MRPCLNCRKATKSKLHPNFRTKLPREELRNSKTGFCLFPFGSSLQSTAMKTLQLSAAVLFGVVAAANADLVIEQKVESPQINSTIVTKIKGDKVRMDIVKSVVGPT